MRVSVESREMLGWMGWAIQKKTNSGSSQAATHAYSAGVRAWGVTAPEPHRHPPCPPPPRRCSMFACSGLLPACMKPWAEEIVFRSLPSARATKRLQPSGCLNRDGWALQCEIPPGAWQLSDPCPDSPLRFCALYAPQGTCLITSKQRPAPPSLGPSCPGPAVVAIRGVRDPRASVATCTTHSESGVLYGMSRSLRCQ